MFDHFSGAPSKGASDLEAVRDRLSDLLDDVKTYFKPGVKVTLVVRTPTHADGSRDLILTDDILNEAVGAILRRKHDTEK